ncbi:hypothetical protein CHR26_12560 [Pseudomonas putida]|nr:hypothetical protein CHR26_12560 [Pseudomonas putida]
MFFWRRNRDVMAICIEPQIGAKGRFNGSRLFAAKACCHLGRAELPARAIPVAAALAAKRASQDQSEG